PGTIHRIEDLEALSEKELKAQLLGKDVSLYILIDRIVVKDFDEDDLHRLSDSVSTAFYEGEGDVYLEISAQAQAPPTPPQGGGIGKDPCGTDSKEKNSKDTTLNPSQEGGIGKDPFGTDSKEKNSKDKTLNPSQ